MSDAPAARERALVARLLRVTPHAAGARALELDGIRWPVLLAEAGRALHPMLAHACAEQAVPVPAESRAILDDTRRRAALVLARRRALMRGALSALRTAGIDAVVLKGFALAHQVYPAPELRVMNDLDLWVAPEALADAAAALGPLGWAVHWRHPALAQQVSEGVVRLSQGEPSQLLEVHGVPGSLSACVPDETPAIWARRTPARLGDIDALVLTPEDQVLHVCVHAARHHHLIGSLPRLLDVALLLARAGPAFDWPALAARARRAGAAGWVATTLAAAQQLFGAPVPGDALAAFAVADAPEFGRLACAQAWAGSEVGAHPLSVMASPSLAAKGWALASRARDVFAGTGSMPPDLLSRLRLTARVTAPGFARALWRGLTGTRDLGAMQQLQGDNFRLADAMVRAGEVARASDTPTAR